MKHKGNLEINNKADADKYYSVTEITGDLSVSADFIAPMLEFAYGVLGKLILVNKYGLWRSNDGLFYAGCKQGFTKDQAIELSKTWEEQDIAKQFITEILNYDK